MSVLLDTNILSELLTTMGSRHVKATVKEYVPAQLFVSVISLGEIQKGVSLLPVGRRQHELAKWFLEVQKEFMSRVIPVDLETAIVWGELSAQMRRAGENIAAADLLIAATALRHGLTVMTRNVRDFTPTGVSLINPWESVDSESCHDSPTHNGYYRFSFCQILYAGELVQHDR